ncbi:myomegalin isoform X5 [Narcine bancroftii]|uniref:myomegalin isoform X5 n=1 Tax=Narcine bancroftii TaxID=1343680 RepID=UPI003832190D
MKNGAMKVHSIEGSRMKEVCRICARELYGNQRRWIFHTTSKLNLQVILSHVLGKEISRDGKAEFACSKCAFMLDRIYRFDTVIARIEALSIERLQKLLAEKDRIKHCIASLYCKTNEESSADAKVEDVAVDMSNLPDVRYHALLQDDFVYSGYESWTEHGEETVETHSCHTSESSTFKSRKCRSCSALRVTDADYEAVCRVPRKLAKTVTSDPPARSASSAMGSVTAEEVLTMPVIRETLSIGPCESRTSVYVDSLDKMSPASSVESLGISGESTPAPSREVAQGEKSAKDDKSPKSDISDGQASSPSLHTQKLDFVLSLLNNVEYRPVQSPKGSKLPIPVRLTSLGSQSSGSLGDGIFRSHLQNSSYEFISRYIEPPRMHLNFDDVADLEDLLQDLLDEYIPICTQNLIEEQQQQLNQYESAAGQCVTELQKAQVQVHGLQDRIQESEFANKMLRENQSEMESELKAMRCGAEEQERVQLGLKEALKNKVKEIEELYHVVDEQNETKAKLKELLHRSQLENLKHCASCQTADGQLTSTHSQQAELLELQGSSFSNQLELQRSQRLISQKEYELVEVRQMKEMMETELQEIYQQKEAAVKHNEELRRTLQQVRGQLLEKGQLYRTLEKEHQHEVRFQEKSILCLKEKLRDKEHFLQQYIELFECQLSKEQSGEDKHVLEDKILEHIKEKDKALERAIEEKFSSLEEKECEIHQLHLALREKEKDLERFRQIFSNNEETINSLDSLVREKELELEQLGTAYKNLQWLKQEVEEKNGCSLKEKDAVNSQLQTALQNSAKEVEDLTAVLITKVCSGPDEMMEQLRLQLQLKDQMLQEVLTDRSKLAADHEQEVKYLLQTISSREQQMKGAAERLTRAIAEMKHELQALRHQLDEKDREIVNFTKQKLQNVSASEIPTEVTHLKELLQEKDPLIQKLLQDSHNKTSLQPETMEAAELTATQQKTDEQVLQAVLDGDEAMAETDQEDVRQTELDLMKEELCLALRKEEETKLELVALQSALCNQQQEFQSKAAEIQVLSDNIRDKEEHIKDLQMQLIQTRESPEVEKLTQELQILRDQLAVMELSTQKSVGKKHQQLIYALEEQFLEQSRLSEALQAERQLYISLVKFHNQTDSTSREKMLQTELLAVQALRGQLEEALRRTQEQIGRLEKETEMPTDSGGYDSENAEDDGSTQCAVKTDLLNDHRAIVEQNHEKASNNSGFQSWIRETDTSNLSHSSLALDDFKNMKLEMQRLREEKKQMEDKIMELKTPINTSVPQIGPLHYQTLEDTEPKRTVEDDLILQEWRTDRKKDNLDVWGLREEIIKLTVKLQNSESIISLLKEQLELNSSQTGEKHFNPELIVNMAKEIERLKSKLSMTQIQHSKPDMHQCDLEYKQARPHSLNLGTLLSQANNETPNVTDAVQQVAVILQGDSPWHHGELGQQSKQFQTKLAEYRQQNKELQEKLVVTEATVKAQDNQLQQYKDMLTESSVEQDNKQVQVDLQDLGYETCGRSENEAEREEASSPEYGEIVFQEHLYPSSKKEMIQQHSLLGKLHSSASHPDFSHPQSIKSCLRREPTFEEDGKLNDIATLHKQINDLKAQMTESDKVICRLQSRIRSISMTSDYASSLERLQNVDRGDVFEALQLDDLEDDDVWQSDGGDHCQSTTQSNAEIKKLIHRVTTLESQLKCTKMAGASAKIASWSGKYDCLIQIQARELSHLRQKMREGRGVCHILKQHLRDTTKSFEELLRANDIDYYMGQCFRDQLAHGSQLAERITHKLTGRVPLENCNKGDQELIVARLNKELEEKNKLIESLNCKLQSQDDTPSKSHILSDSEQSDRASFVSDEQESTNDDLDVYHYEVDLTSEYSHDDQQSTELEAQASPDDENHCENLSQPSSRASASCEGQPKDNATISPSQQPCDMVKSQKGFYSSSVPPSPNACKASYCADFPSQFGSMPFGPAYPTPSTFSLAEVQQELHMLQRQLGEKMAFSGTIPDTSSRLEQAGSVSQSLQQQLLNGSNNLQKTSKSSTVASTPLWGTTDQPVRINTFRDVSSGSSGHQSGINMAGTKVLDEHFREIRIVRQRLEESIETNERLGEQLEMHLSTTTKENAVSPTNVYIQGLEAMTHLSDENQVLKDEILTLQGQINQMSREQAKEMEQMRETLLTTRSKYKLLETELDHWRQENKKLQMGVRDRQQETLQLREEQRCSKNKTSRLFQEMTMLQQQLTESHQLTHSLQSEIKVYERMYGRKKTFPVYRGSVENHAFDINDFLMEIRGLRIQLEQAIHTNGCLRKQLKEQMDEHRPASLNINYLTSSASEQSINCVPSPPVRDTGLFLPFQMHSKSASSVADFNVEETSQKNDGILNDSMSQISCSLTDDELSDGCFTKKNGSHAIGHIDDYNALQQQIMEGRLLVHRMESIVQSCVNAAFLEIDRSKDLDHQMVKQLFSGTNTLRQILDETCSLLKMFWITAQPNPDADIRNNQKEQLMKEEISRLRNKITEQEYLLQNAISRLKATNQVKEGMEQFIVNQLKRTHDVLKKARNNLEPIQMNDYTISGGKTFLNDNAEEKSKRGYTHPRGWNIMNPLYSEAEARSLGQHSLPGKIKTNGPNLIPVGNITNY